MCFSLVLDGYPNLEPASGSTSWRMTRHLCHIYIQSQINAFQGNLTWGWNTSKIWTKKGSHSVMTIKMAFHSTITYKPLRSPKKFKSKPVHKMLQSIIQEFIRPSYTPLFTVFYMWQCIKVCDVTSKGSSLSLSHSWNPGSRPKQQGSCRTCLSTDNN